MFGISGGSVLKRIIGLVIVLNIIRVVISISPLHVYFDYKRDITELKNQHIDRFHFFPDELPRGASEAVWKSTPKSLSGFGEYHMLTFNAGDDYLKRIYDKYDEVAVVYKYGKDITGYEGWVNEDTGYVDNVQVPNLSCDDYAGNSDIEIMIFRDERNVSCGLYVDWDKGNICFWEEEGR